MTLLLFILITSLSTHAANHSYTLRIPKAKDSSHHKLANMTLDTIRFMAGLYCSGKVSELEDQDSETQNWLGISKLNVVPEYTELLKEASTKESYLDVLQVLKMELKKDGALSARHLRHANFTLPNTTERLQEITNYKSWPSKTIEMSKVKGTKRLLFRSPNIFPKMSVAETIAMSGQIRETEIILKREDGTEDYDFYAYDQDGQLATTSLFHNKQGKETVGPVPHTCMACHYDGKNRVFQTKPLSFNPGT